MKENDNQFINNGYIYTKVSPSMMIKPHSNLHKIFTNHLTFRKKTMETRILKTFSIKMEEDVGTSKPKKHAKLLWVSKPTLGI